MAQERIERLKARHRAARHCVRALYNIQNGLALIEVGEGADDLAEALAPLPGIAAGIVDDDPDLIEFAADNIRLGPVVEGSAIAAVFEFARHFASLIGSDVLAGGRKGNEAVIAAIQDPAALDRLRAAIAGIDFDDVMRRVDADLARVYPPADLGRWIRVSDAALVLGLRPDEVTRLCDRGVLRHHGHRQGRRIEPGDVAIYRLDELRHQQEIEDAEGRGHENAMTQRLREDGA